MAKLQLRTTPSFERDFKRLDPSVRRRILERLDWLADHPDQIGTPMRYLPSELKGLHKFRAGDYRVLFWPDLRTQTITLYGVDHRRSVYGHLH
ncbi:MAG: type II toxin-antitoxin system RelE/ParE family toxin [Elusimicrobia bacterium]|nr:type II toxin-antitoxin system RelE/ParE family toxin [Elusimicrobiota bacterium]